MRTFIKTIITRIQTGNICRIFDEKLLDEFLKTQKNGMKYKGYEITDSTNLFGISITEKVSKTTLNSFKWDKNGNYRSNEIPSNIIKILLESKKLESLVTDYFGYDVRLDDMYFKCSNGNCTSISEGWHTDNVGLRLKVFICVGSGNDNPSTFIIPSSHLNKFKANFLEDFKRLTTKKQNPKKKKDELKISYENDTIVIFDTNLMHRGDYEKHSGYRNTIVLEFMNRHKSNLLAKNNPCGPGQSFDKKIVFSKVLKSVLKKSILIDKEILFSNSDGDFEYKITK